MTEGLKSSDSRQGSCRYCIPSARKDCRVHWNEELVLISTATCLVYVVVTKSVHVFMPGHHQRSKVFIRSSPVDENVVQRLVDLRCLQKVLVRQVW